MKFYYICVREGQGGEWNIPFAYTEIKSRRIAMRRVLFTVSILCSIFLFGCATAEIPSDPAPEASNPETSSDEIFSSFGNDATSDNSWQADESTSSEPPSVNEDIFVSDYTPGEENVYGVSNANLSAGGLRFEAMMTAQGDYIYYIEGTPSAEYPAVLKKVRTDGMEMEILTDNVAGSRMLAVNESGTVIIYYVGIAYNNSSRPSICLSAYNNETGISESLLSFDANNIFIIGMDETSSRLYIAEKYGDSPDRSSQYNLGYYDIGNAQFIICKERKKLPEPAKSVPAVLYRLRSVVVSVRILRLPSPGVRAHFLNAVLGLPAKLLLRLAGVGVAGGDIAGAAGLDLVRDLHAGGFLEVLHDIQHAVALSGSQIVNGKSGIVFDLLQGLHMSLRQIDHMDVVSYAGSVRSVIVVSEYVELFQLAHGNLGDVGHQVVGDAVGILTDHAALVSADGIEVTQKHHVPFRVRLLDVGEDLLQHGLGPAVRVGALSLRALLRDGDDGRIAVNSGRRGEDDVLHAMLSHHVHQGQGPGDIVLIILPGLCHGLAYRLESGEMDAGIDLFLFKNGVQRLSVQDVRLVKRHGLSRDLFHALQGLLTGIAEIVHNHHVITCILQLHNRMAADITGSACY